MAFNMKLQVASVLIVAVMFALHSAHGVSSQKEGESSAQKPAAGQQLVEGGSGSGGAGATANKTPALGGLPVIVLRQQGGSGSGKPDIWLGWMNWEGVSFLKPLAGPFAQQIQPFTQEMSGMLMNNLPGFSSIYTQFDQFGNQISSLNPMNQLMSQFGGSGSSGSGSGSGSGGFPGLSSLSGLFQGRR